MVEEGEGGKKKTERTSKRFGRVRKREEEEEEKGKGPLFPDTHIHCSSCAPDALAILKRREKRGARKEEGSPPPFFTEKKNLRAAQ